jgi:hypothetical protein
MKKINKLLSGTALALALSAGFGAAHADISAAGNFNAAGYAVLGFNTVGGVVDMQFTGGYGDATFSLFNAAGAHLMSNDDSNSLNPHLTQFLSAGNYSLLVSYCCQSIYGYAQANGGAFVNTDGYNSGSYVTGGSGTLAGMEAYLDAQTPYAANASYTLTISNATLAPQCPSPPRWPSPRWASPASASPAASAPEHAAVTKTPP